MKHRAILDYLISSLSLDIRSTRLDAPTFIPERRPEEIWRQKIYCVLSSQFNAQRAAYITDRIVREVPFFDYLLPPRKVEEACYQFLCSSGINYRFPKIRAQQIALCWFPFCQVKDEYQEYVCSFANEELARSDIVGKFPGIGLKQASMFLRNIGACKNLSVVDVHVLYYLKTCHGWEVEQLTPKRYLEAEEIMRADALCHGLELNIFDTVVWSAARALKRASYV